MQRKPAKRSSLFLMELIIAILFFCLASAICVRFFVKSHLIEQETTDLSHAANHSSSVAEIIRSGHDISECLKAQYPDAVSEQSDGYTIYFNKDWESCKKSDSAYILVLHCDETDDFIIGQIRVSETDNKKEIYNLEVKKYQQKEVRLR